MVAVDLAEDLRRRRGIQGLASTAQVEDLIDAVGLTIRPWPFAPPVCGLLHRTTIGIRPDLTAGERRAVLAHELGHWLMGHNGSLLYVPLSTCQLLRHREEREAQAFAGTLLLGRANPRSNFDELVQEACGDGIPAEFLFRYFDAVSPRVGSRLAMA